MDTEISKDSYNNIWLYSNGKSFEIDTFQEVEAIRDACEVFLEEAEQEDWSEDEE